MGLHLFNYIQMLALLTSILCLKGLFKTPYLYFFPFLLLMVFASFAQLYTEQQHSVALSNGIFNVTAITEFIFFYFLLFKAIKKQLFKKIILVLTVIYINSSIIDIAFVQGLQNVNSYAMFIGTIAIMVAVFFYFYDAFENADPGYLIREPMFLISIGIFLFYLGNFTYNLMYPYLQRNNLQHEKRVFAHINHHLIVFEYFCIIIGLIICSRNNIASKQQL